MKGTSTMSITKEIIADYVIKEKENTIDWPTLM